MSKINTSHIETQIDSGTITSPSSGYIKYFNDVGGAGYINSAGNKTYFQELKISLKQTITNNTAINLGTINTQNIYLNINPTTTQNFNSTITLPTTPFDGQIVEVVFGGTITSGNVATTLSLPASVVFPANYTFDTTWIAYESFQLIYDSVITKWRLINK